MLKNTSLCLKLKFKHKLKYNNLSLKYELWTHCKKGVLKKTWSLFIYIKTYLNIKVYRWFQKSPQKNNVDAIRRNIDDKLATDV